MPALIFTTPPHPAEAVRDPHDLPSFETDDNQREILYLPPLLSSLPANAPPHPGQPAELTTSTRLPDIDPVSLSLHRALHSFRPKDARYASVPYEEAFNWDDLRLPEDEERDWYCVAFRSKRKTGSDGNRAYSQHRWEKY